MNELPRPSIEASAASQALTAWIGEKIQRQGGWISFANYMDFVLYAPNLGYYSGGAQKFGEGGDFVTAPHLTTLFGASLATAIAPILTQTAAVIYEFGAGSGRLAVDIIQALPTGLLNKYCIVERSEALRVRQAAYFQQALGEDAKKIEFLSELPEVMNGVIIGNELLDALACERIEWRDDGIWQQGVVYQDGRFAFQAQPLPAILHEDLPKLPIEAPYISEIHPQMAALVRTLAQKLQCGAMIWLDYGFDEYEYYHPQRSEGTLIGHYRHHTIDDPFFWPGLMDLTAHVNFSRVVEVATAAGLDLIGYTHQAQFLIATGILERLAAITPTTSEEYIRHAAGCQLLLAPHEMGELFKVMALGRGIDPDWPAFAGVDLSAKL